MKIKGMRNVATIQTLRNHARPSSRAEMAAQLARLEHERYRLERELQIFEEKKARSLEGLQQTRAHIDELKQALYDSGENQSEVTKKSLAQVEPNGKEARTSTKSVRTVTLGY
jgi:ATP-dependent Clp protease ATP-binding subunit ClpA